MELLYPDSNTFKVDVPSPCCLVIFGASGDLARRKLVPSLYRLNKNKTLPDKFFVLGVGRTEMSIDTFRESLKLGVKEAFPRDFDETSWSEFVVKLQYSIVDYSIMETYVRSVKERLVQLEEEYNTGGSRIFYLAIPPTQFRSVITNLGETGLAKEEKGYTHIIIEKPFGRDLETAQELNRFIEKYFAEHQVFRIDHYLAKETVQNILMFRFANSIFEPLWNRRYIDSIQITATETLGVEKRAGYYEEAGIIRDMFQNHMLQLLALTAMEPPVAFEDEWVRVEKYKVFRSIRPIPLGRLDEHLVVAQYGKGIISGEEVPGYREETGVSNDSITPTYSAMRLFIDNWRWNGVPFYLRSGKRLHRKMTEIAVRFRAVPHLMFSKIMSDDIEPNSLVFKLQPDEGISLTFQTKSPSSRMSLNPVSMQFSYQKDVLLDAYEWALLDCMFGDQTLYWSQDGVEATWALLTPVLKMLEATLSPEQIPTYPSGSDGPKEAALLLKRDGRTWRPLGV
ncbi:MAG: glucose-6-phosphate dehydrogenase [Nitrospirae bacterium RBG_16_43_11]|nr:MAG: glucose-6-phosphate dehydrogenase [Nitrospirae bacterium RBG_16_43_11]